MSALARTGNFIHDFREEIVAVGTLFIAAFTVILAAATALLYFATRDLVRGADKTAERQLRAYVHTAESTVTNISTGNGNVTFTIRIKNFGQTPAHKLSVLVAVELAPFPTDVSTLTKPSTESLKNITLGPTAENTITMTRAPFSQTEIADMAARKALYVYGTIRYEDAFGESRSTKFCLIKGGGNQYPLAGTDLFINNEGNEAT